MKPLIVHTDEVKPYPIGDTYLSRMILDHVITGQQNVVQLNHGTLNQGAVLEGAVHEDDEVYYILSGEGRIQLGDETRDIKPGTVVFIPKGVFHALDNRDGKADMTILTVWRNYKANDAYAARVKDWGVSFKLVDEK